MSAIVSDLATTRRARADAVFDWLTRHACAGSLTLEPDSFPTLRADLGLSRRAVDCRLDRLVEEGLITIPYRSRRRTWVLLETATGPARRDIRIFPTSSVPAMAFEHDSTGPAAPRLDELLPWQGLDLDERRAYAEITAVRTGHRGIRVFIADELGVVDE